MKALISKKHFRKFPKVPKITYKGLSSYDILITEGKGDKKRAKQILKNLHEQP